MRDIFKTVRRIFDEVIFQLSRKEVGRIIESFKIKSISTEKPLIKYHIKLTTDCEFPNILVISVTNLLDTF